MKRERILKKLIASFLLTIIVIGQFNGINFISEAANINTDGKSNLYLALAETRGTFGYGMTNSENATQGAIKEICNIESFETASTTSESVISSNLYCIKGGYGYTWETQQNPSGIVTYNSSNFIQSSVDGYYNEILWVIDHMYVPGEDNKEIFLNSIGITSEYDDGLGKTLYYYDPTVTGYEYSNFSNGDVYLYTVTDDDIVAVQQAAIWYYTNYKVDPTNEASYNQLGNNTSWLKYTIDGSNYSELYEYNKTYGEGPARNEFATILYNYLIDASTAAIEETGTYTLKNKTVKLWTATTNGQGEQPIVEIHSKEKEFDLALRKTITSITSSEGTVKSIVNSNEQSATRSITVDKSTLDNEDEDTSTDTATYKHRKDPVVVEQGDTVKYTLTIYNEGQQAGYATQIVDQLPGLSTSGLRLLNTNDITSSTGNVYAVSYSTVTNKVTLTLKSTTPKSIPAYDGTTLSNETVTLECEVMTTADSSESTILTNIAYIAEEYNRETGETITTTGDRDSQTTTSPSYSGENDSSQNGITYGTDMGYTGNTSNLTDLSKNAFYKGEQDDDDFEKLVVLPIIPSSYKIQLEKIDSEDDAIKLSGAVFEITTGSGDKYTKTTDDNGLIEISDIVLATEGTQTISINEVTPPTGYNAILTETLQIEITTIIEDRTYKITKAEINSTNSTESQVTLEGTTIKVIVPNEKITGKYDIQLEKVDSENSNTKLAGATFNITINGETETLTTNSQGKISVNNITLTETGTQIIEIEEITAPTGYKKVLTEAIEMQAEVTVVDGEYKVTDVTIVNDEAKENYVTLENGTIKVTVPNEKITGTYNIQAIKEDTEGNKLAGAIFKIEQIDELNNVLQTYDNLTTSSTGIVETGSIEIKGEGTYIYRITEVEAPSTYIKEKVSTIIKVITKIENDAYTVGYQKVSGNEKGISQTGNTIKITIINKQLDLSLRKFIKAIDGETLTASRTPIEDTTKLINGTDTTAKYSHIKAPVVVENESVVTYNIKIYNESTIAGIATIIKDQLPLGLKFDLTSLSSDGSNYYIISEKDNKYIVTYDETNNIITFTLDTTVTTTNLAAFANTTTLDSDTLEFDCVVDCVADDEENIYLTNIAYIYEEKTVDGTVITTQTGIDRDSEPYTKPEKTANDLNTVGDDIGYKGNTSNPDDLNQTYVHYKGEQDDDDFEKLVILPIVPGTYNIELVKVDNNDTSTKLQGATFKITYGNGQTETLTTDLNGLININDIVISKEGTQTIEIEEITAPTGYKKLLSSSLKIEIEVVIENRTYKVYSAKIVGSVQGSAITLKEDTATLKNTVQVTIANEKMSGEYKFQLEKVDSEYSSIKLEGAVFEITVNNGTTQTATTDKDGLIKINNISLAGTEKQTIKIKEITPPEGYNKLLTEELVIEATVEAVSENYEVTEAQLTNTDPNGSIVTMVEDTTGAVNTIKLTVPNEIITGEYNIKLEKVDSQDDNKKLEGAVFEITVNNGAKQTVTTDVNGLINLDKIELTGTETQVITINEITPPSGYNKILTEALTIEAEVEINSGSYNVKSAVIKNTDTKGSTIALEGDTIEIVVPNEKITGKYNVQLLKVDSEDKNTKLTGAVFEIVINNGTTHTMTTDTNGMISLNNIVLSRVGTQTITIKETTAPSGYNKLLTDELTVEATVSELNGKYVITNAEIKSTNSNGSEISLIEDTTESINTVQVTILNEKITGKYNFQLEKVDSQDSSIKLQGATFKVTLENGQEQTLTTDTNGLINIDDIILSKTGTQTITIEETIAPDGYNKLLGQSLKIQVTVSEKVIDDKSVYEVTNQKIISGNITGTSITKIEDTSNAQHTVKVVIPNEKVTGQYNFQLEKVDSNNSNIKLQGATFKITVDNTQQTKTTNENGLIEINDIILSEEGTQTIIIEETGVPTGYNKLLTEAIEIEVVVENVDGIYKVTSAQIIKGEITGSLVTLEDDTIKAIVPNEKITGVYNIKVVKEDTQGEKLAGAKFKIELLDENNNTVSTYNNLVTTSTGVVETGNIEIAEEGVYTYRITETAAPNKYIKEDISTIIKVTTKIKNGAYTVSYEKVSGAEKEISLISNTIQITMVNKQIDLALRKSITAINDQELTRLPEVDVTKLEGKTSTTAKYNHDKTPVLVDTEDYIEYTLRIYNEGSIGAYAGEIKDYLPEGIEYVEGIDIDGKYTIQVSENGRTLTITNIGKTIIPAYQGQGTPSCDEIKIKCQITAERQLTAVTLTNIAEITKYIDEDEIERTEDRDSQPENFPEDIKTDRENYEGNGNDGEYVKGQQDDDDFEKVVLKQLFDLSLRKVITEVDGEPTGEGRNIKITALDELTSGTSKTAQYNHIKTPVVAKNRSIVKYNINIYNEAAVDGIATIIKDQLPSGLELDLTSLSSRIIDETTQYYITTTKENKYIVTYDKTANIVTFTLDTENVTNLQAFKNREELDSDTLEFDCKVNCVADTNSNIYLTNIAYIYEEKTVDGTVIRNQQKEDRDSEPYTKPDEDKDDLNTIGNDIGYIGNETNPTDLSKIDTYYKGEQDDDDFEKLVILPQVFDLKLVKYIDELNGEDVGNRILSVDTSKLNTVGKDGKTITTAEYEMEKNPVAVKAGDFIKYTFRVYNEGNYDGYATEISEDIPEGLEALIIGRDESGNTIIYTWDGVDLKDVTKEIKATNMYNSIVATNSVWGYSQGTSIITTNALQDELIKEYGVEGYTTYADKENNIDYKEISVILRVKEDAVPDGENPIRNEAAITEDKAVDETGEEVKDSSGSSIEDRDSHTDEWNKEDSGKDYNDDGWEIYEEDDEDYDNIILKEFDLSLRKQIVKIENTLFPTRYAKLNNSETNTIYDYYDVYNNKATVKAGDIITYSIRIYNEGEIDGYASLVVDTLPSGLEFVPYTEGDGSTNDIYGWKLVEGTTNVYETDYLSYENDTNKGKEESTIIKAYTGTGEADFEELEIQCKVKDNITRDESLLNVAQIADDSDEDGKPIRDKDSEPGKTDDEEKWKEGDDLDIEILQLQEFDLALRKFITGIEETGSESVGDDGEPNITEVTSRIPQISYDEETNQITYKHSKEPLVVHVGDTVIYTIRVYNEGEIDGYAKEITDNIPEYLEYLPSHSTNQEFKWKMYDSKGRITENVLEAVSIKTTYLSKEENEDNLIKAFSTNGEISETNPEYKDVKVAFKVKDPESTEYVVVNFAQISDDSDANGEPIKDKDSIPDNGEETPKEDDEDIEKVKVEYFDLSLLKYVTKVIVTEDGKQTINQTGNVGDINDIVPKVEINRKKIDSTEVKFAYTIKITNEGQIAGYATEITDYIPEGLEFKAEDNPNWTAEGVRIISTRQLEDVLLQPGESSEVEVILTWINGESNLGLKTNTAEISEDNNDEDVPDKDSTPDNQKDGEDDIDDAEVILSIKTGGGLSDIYTKLTLVLCVIILAGIILIKKYVL